MEEEGGQRDFEGGGEVCRLIKGEKGKGRVWLGDIRVVYDNL